MAESFQAVICLLKRTFPTCIDPLQCVHNNQSVKHIAVQVHGVSLTKCLMTTIPFGAILYRVHMLKTLFYRGTEIP